MKASFVVLLVSLFAVSTHGQPTSARAITKKVVAKETERRATLQTNIAPKAAEPAIPGSTQANPTTTTVPAATAAKVAPPKPPEKTKEEKGAATKKIVEFQKRRAAEGYATAQYDLGVRYLKGDGVEKNPEEARKWLEAAAKQGNSMATQKLAELEKAKK